MTVALSVAVFAWGAFSLGAILGSCGAVVLFRSTMAEARRLRLQTEELLGKVEKSNRETKEIGERAERLAGERWQLKAELAAMGHCDQ